MTSNHLKFWIVQLVFPASYFGLAALKSLFEIFVRHHYEPKFGQWGTFQLELYVLGFFTCFPTICYLTIVTVLKNLIEDVSKFPFAWMAFFAALVTCAGWWLLPGVIGIGFLLWNCGIPIILPITFIKLHQHRLTKHNPVNCV